MHCRRLYLPLLILVSIVGVSACQLDVEPVDIPDELNEFLGTECLADKDCLKGQFCDAATCQWFCSELHLCPKDMWCDYSTNRCTTTPPGDRTDLAEVLGQPCRSQDDCPSDTLCMWMPGGLICTVDCASQRECTTIQSDACCLRQMDSYYCAPADMCPADGDGDAVDGEGEADVSDTDGDEAVCTWDSYRCNDAHTVERCNSLGQWQTYKPCSDGAMCYQGVCVTGGEDCENTNLPCCPDTLRCRGLYEISRCVLNEGEYEWAWEQDCGVNELCDDGQCVVANQPATSDGDDADGDLESHPGGCTADSHCPDDATYCFIWPGDSEGECLPQCDQPGIECLRGHSCTDGRCVPIEGYCWFEEDCGDDEFCHRGIDGGDGRCEPYCFNDGQYCPQSYYCAENPMDPNFGRCLPSEDLLCMADTECPQTAYCLIGPGQEVGFCQTYCNMGGTCDNPLICCEDGHCGNEGACGQTGACQDCAYACDPYLGCIPYCPDDCPADKPCCDAGSNYSCYACPECVNPVICDGFVWRCCPGSFCEATVYGTIGYCLPL